MNPDVTITKPPEYGTAVLETRELFSAYAKDNARAKCNQKKIRQAAVIYKASGHVGSDALEVSAVLPSGHMFVYRIAIKIVGRKKE